MIFKKTFLSLLFMAPYLVADESFNQKTSFSEIMNSIGESKFIDGYSKHIQKKIDQVIHHKIMNYGDELASQKYQELGFLAQSAVGISQNNHLPIKKINPDSLIANSVAAIAESDAIYVNEKMLDARTYGAMYSALCHEAIHVKYHDKSVDQLLELSVLIGSSMAMFLVLQSLNFVTWPKSLSFMIGLGFSSYTSFEYRCFMERRADIEGHYATKCSSCVLEHAQLRKILLEEGSDLLINSGYLSFKDLEQMAQDLGNEKCSYHYN